jgi:hypothetical protein
MNLEQQPSKQQDLEAAIALMKEYPLLKNDGLTKQVLETGIGGNGKTIEDLDKFVMTRGIFLELENIKKSNPDLYDAAVIHSVRPDQEKNWEN